MRIVRRLTHVLIIVLTLVVGAAAAAVIVSQTAWFKNWLRGYIVAQANQYLNGTLSIERLGGNLFFGLEMENIGVSLDGSQVVAVKDLGLDYNVFQLITKGLSVDSIRLDKPVIYLRREGDTWSLSRLVKKQAAEADREGPTEPDRDRRDRAHRWIDRDRPAGRHLRRRRCRSGSIISTRSCRSTTSRSATRSRSRSCRSADRSRRSR